MCNDFTHLPTLLLTPFNITSPMRWHPKPKRRPLESHTKSINFAYIMLHTYTRIHTSNFTLRHPQNTPSPTQRNHQARTWTTDADKRIALSSRSKIYLRRLVLVLVVVVGSGHFAHSGSFRRVHLHTIWPILLLNGLRIFTQIHSCVNANAPVQCLNSGDNGMRNQKTRTTRTMSPLLWTWQTRFIFADGVSLSHCCLVKMAALYDAHMEAKERIKGVFSCLYDWLKDHLYDSGRFPGKE